MRYGSVCSGIEAASVAWHPLGWRASWLAEIEAFPAAVLAHHYPEVPNLGDMTTIARRVMTGEVDAPDVLVGGTPCQAFSVAGLRQSLADARGNLTLKFVELADAVDHVRAARGEQPAIIVWENVPGVLNTPDNAFGCFLGALAGEDCELQPAGKRWSDAGCVYGPARAVAWRILDAQYFGLAQRRRRVFVVASARDGFDPATVLFEWDGVRRDSAPSRESGKVAPTIPSRSTGGGGLGTDFDCDGGLIHADPIARCVTAGEAKRQDWETDDVTNTLNCFDVGDIRAVDIVAQPVALQDVSGRDKAQNGRGWNDDGTSYTLDAAATQGVAVPLQEVGKRTGVSTTDPRAGIGIGKEGDPMFTLQAGAQHGVAISVALRGIDGGAACEVGDDVAFTLRASSGGGDKPHVMAPVAGVIPYDLFQITAPVNRQNRDESSPCHTLARDNAAHAAVVQPATAFAQNQRDEVRTMEVAGALAAEPGMKQQTYVQAAMQVRRLTPRECERLQGFPDDYTLIPVRGKPAADGPRYKALGNSMAVPVMRWIGRRISDAIHSPGGGA